MNANLVIIDERGTIWALGKELRLHLATRRSDLDLARYCVDKLGFVLVDAKSNGTIFVNFAEDIVAPVALVSLMQWLHDRPDSRYVLYQGGLNKQPLLTPTIAHARKRIGEVIEAATPHFSFEATDVAVEVSPFRKLWPVAQEIHVSDISDELKFKLLDKLFDGRFTLSVRHQESGDFRIKALGTAIHQYQFSQCRGYETYRDMHDRDYGNWIADGLKRLTTSDAPKFQFVSVPLKFLDSPNRVMHRYSRLLFAPEVGGEQRLLTASIVC